MLIFNNSNFKNYIFDSYRDILKFMKIFGKKYKNKSNFLKSLCEIMRNITYNDIDSNLKFKKYFFGRIFYNLFLSGVKSSEDFWNYADLINHKLNRNVYEIFGFN